MARGVADVVEVVVLAAGAHAFLRGGGALVGPPLDAGEDVLELHHAGVGEQQRRIVVRHERARRHDLVVVAREELEKGLADVVRAGHGGPGLSGVGRSVRPIALDSGPAAWRKGLGPRTLRIVARGLAGSAGVGIGARRAGRSALAGRDHAERARGEVRGRVVERSAPRPRRSSSRIAAARDGRRCLKRQSSIARSSSSLSISCSFSVRFDEVASAIGPVLSGQCAVE